MCARAAARGTPRPARRTGRRSPATAARRARCVGPGRRASSGTSAGHVRSKGARMTRWVRTGISWSRSATFLRMSSKRSRRVRDVAEIEFDHRADVHRRARHLEQDERAVQRIEVARQRPLLPKPPSPRLADGSSSTVVKVRRRHGQDDELGDPVAPSSPRSRASGSRFTRAIMHLAAVARVDQSRRVDAGDAVLGGEAAARQARIRRDPRGSRPTGPSAPWRDHRRP